jgi:hypothetical protein
MKDEFKTPDEFENDDISENQTIHDNSSTNLPYDGSQVVSSENLYDEQEKNIPAEKRDQPSKNLDQPKPGETNKEIEKLVLQNKMLLKKINEYNRFIEHYTSTQHTQQNQQKTEYKTEMDQKLDALAKKTKAETYTDILETLKEETFYTKKKEEFRSKNPDLANEPSTEYIIGSLAAYYIQEGLDFDSAVERSINEFRATTGRKAPENSTKTNQTQYNTPTQKPYQKTSPHINTFIEGSGPSMPDKQFRASELIDMQINRPDEYLRLQPKIMKAYRDGRVIFD